MPARSSFDYAIIRVVPELERGERMNVGVVLLCRQRRYLGMRLALDEARLTCLWPALSAQDVAAVRSQLEGMRRVCDGATDAGPIARLSQAERFHWLVAPSSTSIQTSATHSGLCSSPSNMLDELLARLVALPETHATDATSAKELREP